MASSIFTVAANTSTGNQTLTGDLSGATPVACIIECTRATALSTVTDEAVYSKSIWDGTTSYLAAIQCENSSASMDTRRRASATDAVYIFTTTGTEDGSATFVSFGANAVTIDWDNAPASAYLLKVTLYSGCDITVGRFSPSTSIDGTDSITGLGQGRAVYVLSVNRTGFDGNGADMELLEGFAGNEGPTAGIQNVGACWWSEDAAADANVRQLWSDDYVLNSIDGAGVLDWQVEVTSFNTDGATFTTRITAPPAGIDVGFMLFHGDDCTGGANFTNWGTGTTQAVILLPDAGVPPTTGMTICCGVTSSDARNVVITATASVSMFGFATFDADGEAAIGLTDQDAASNARTHAYMENACVLVMSSANPPVVTKEYTWNSWRDDIDGFDATEVGTSSGNRRILNLGISITGDPVVTGHPEFYNQMMAAA